MHVPQRQRQQRLVLHTFCSTACHPHQEEQFAMGSQTCWCVAADSDGQRTVVVVVERQRSSNKNGTSQEEDEKNIVVAQRAAKLAGDWLISWRILGFPPSRITLTLDPSGSMLSFLLVLASHNTHNTHNTHRSLSLLYYYCLSLLLIAVAYRYCLSLLLIAVAAVDARYHHDHSSSLFHMWQGMDAAAYVRHNTGGCWLFRFH
jgi:hypothetical protein